MTLHSGPCMHDGKFHSTQAMQLCSACDERENEIIYGNIRTSATPHKFTCANCKQDFESYSTHEESREELERKFPDGKRDDIVSVCDHCYAKVLKALSL